MLIGIVSDTHGQVPFAQQAVRMLESLGVEAVIHCGDIGSTEIPRLFAAWPTHFVFGNVDYDEADLRRAIKQANLTCHSRYGEIELAGRKIAFLHSDDAGQFRTTIESGKFDLVCYGHTHIAKQQQVGKTIVLNPGGLYRASKHSIATVNLVTMEVNFVTV